LTYTTRYSFDSHAFLESYYTVEYINAGYVLGASCTENFYIDAAGSGWTVGVYQETITDGAGGYYYVTTPNYSPCGAWPNGYALSYSSGSASFDYIQGNTGVTATFVYGTSYTASYSDGTYDGVTASAGTNVDYPAGHIFYTYYDGAQDRNIFYNFDGYSGYYETNDAP
jgi:hypothetical protein